MYKAYKEKAEFFLVYIREAHASDSRSPDPDKRFATSQPKELAERALVAGTCVTQLNLSLPVLIDDMKGTTEKAYGGWPDRICLIDADGKMVFQSGPGPAGFKPAQAEQAMKKMLAP